MNEIGTGETFSPTSNDLLLLLTSQHLQGVFIYGTIAQTARDVQDVQNSPAISMGRTSSFQDRPTSCDLSAYIANAARAVSKFAFYI